MIGTLKPMKNSILLCLANILLFYNFSWGSSHSAGYGGSTQVTVTEGNTSAPTYVVLSAGLSGEVAYSGVVQSSDNTSKSISFSLDENASENTVYPFAADGIFDPTFLLPQLTASVSSGSLSSVSIDYHGGFTTQNGYSPGFDGGAPALVVDAPPDLGESATATATVNSDGRITAITVNSGGTGYDSSNLPEVSIIGGPHLVKISDPNSANYGRVFLINDNNRSRLNLDDSRLESGETIESVFTAGTIVEVVRAPTLGNVLGADLPDLPTNWTYGYDEFTTASATDWIYLSNGSGYERYNFFHVPAYESGGIARGWRSVMNPGFKPDNNLVLFPDEAFLVAKRTSGAATITTEGVVETANTNLCLPATGNFSILNNPYSTDMKLCELIPSTAIGTGTGQFRPGATDADGDAITFLSGSQWKRFWYKTGVNSAVTSMHVIGTRRPMEGGSTATTLDEDDLYIGSGNVSGLESCNAAGVTSGITGNDSNYTKVSISGGTSDLQGFSITISDVNGYLLYDGGTSEANATTGAEITSGNGSLVLSKINGTHEIVASGNGYVVLNLQRDVNFLNSEGTRVWSIGAVGAGYSGTANFYCIGGTSGVTAEGTISANGSTITVTTNGSSYADKPQAIVSGGGWRYTDNSARDHETLSSSSGLILEREASGGIKSFIESINPFH